MFLEKKHIHKHIYIDVTKEMYDGVITSLRTIIEEINTFPIIISLHQGFDLRPYLFARYDLTRHIQDEVPWYILFADYIIFN